eukprot:scaffold63412_cov66-Phaeocystis_antarctica.AAC.3
MWRRRPSRLANLAPSMRPGPASAARAPQVMAHLLARAPVRRPPVRILARRRLVLGRERVVEERHERHLLSAVEGLPPARLARHPPRHLLVLDRTVDKLNVRHGRRVAGAAVGLQDAAVAAGSLLEAMRQDREELDAVVLGCHIVLGSLACRVRVLLGIRHHAIRQAAQLLGLGQCGADALVMDQLRHHRSEHVHPVPHGLAQPVLREVAAHSVWGGQPRPSGSGRLQRRAAGADEPRGARPEGGEHRRRGGSAVRRRLGQRPRPARN